MATDLQSGILQVRDALRAEYEQMVDAACDGAANDPTDVMRVLAALSVDVETFEADCARVAQRKVWAAELAEEPKRQKKLEAANAVIADLQRAQQLAWAESNKMIAAQAAIRDGLLSQLRPCAEAKRELLATAAVEVVAREREIRDRMSVLGRCRQDMDLDLTQKRQQAQLVEERVSHKNTDNDQHFINDEQRQWSRGQLAESQKQIRNMEAQLAAMAAESEALLLELAKLDQRKLTP